ncbi:uncharacterized protein BDZ99DRAFT_474428 [Mytilinidion resinicola]|uniref:PSP1 C-terminal domain-containing protein n=1 Tax=Mytilinidion resinicola TaxID=574789 RepID=A0A6A6YTT8_9PEZI|nr:uncharacterized protein BDZ99DRAFT_474428 [Mytilinidion resinicola]KAF2812220.1 hypothetical protein BDZ99DRAFT_474428 [Mytilinidion resinicola]
MLKGCCTVLRGYVHAGAVSAVKSVTGDLGRGARQFSIRQAKSYNTCYGARQHKTTLFHRIVFQKPASQALVTALATSLASVINITISAAPASTSASAAAASVRAPDTTKPASVAASLGFPVEPGPTGKLPTAHFSWYKMFSRTAMNNGSLYPGPDGMLATAHQPLATALGQMTAGGTTLPQQYVGGVDMELKPRIMVRVAATHEVQVLREKEGSEAKAKRICQAKVANHGLNMEILDAEYQLEKEGSEKEGSEKEGSEKEGSEAKAKRICHAKVAEYGLNMEILDLEYELDYKKLPFYYYADAYINFNKLVTDLFKVYKTRIWMSAVNPASFASAIGYSNIPLPSANGFRARVET